MAAFAAKALSAQTIGLDEYVRLALQRDFQVKLVELDDAIAYQNARSATAYWDPAVRAQYVEGALGAGGGAASSFNTQDGVVADLGIDANLPTGARVTVDAAAAKFESTFGDTYGANAGISLSQPLLRNFGAAFSKSRIRIAKASREQSRYALDQEVMSTVTRAISLYNQVALAKDSLRVAEQSRELARQLVADTRKRADLGAIEARGVEVAETRLALRETNAVTQRRIYHEALNEFKRLVSNEALQLVSWQVEIDAMPAPEDWSGELASDFEHALENRPDYRQALLEIEKANHQARASENEYLPQLDLTARYSRTAFSNSYSNSFDQLSDAEDDIFFGIVFRRPLLNTAADAGRSIAALRREQSQIVEKQLQQTIAIQLDNAYRRLEAETIRRDLTRQGREFAQRSLEAEERKLNLGQSTTFFVLESQEDLAGAQIRELEAIVEYNIAVARYHQIRGSTLDAYGIDLR